MAIFPSRLRKICTSDMVAVPAGQNLDRGAVPTGRRSRDRNLDPESEAHQKAAPIPKVAEQDRATMTE